MVGGREAGVPVQCGPVSRGGLYSEVVKSLVHTGACTVSSHVRGRGQGAGSLYSKVPCRNWCEAGGGSVTNGHMDPVPWTE